MARTLIAVQDSVITGLEATYTAAIADGHYFANTGKEVIHVKNGDAADKTITIQTPATVEGLAIAENAVVVTAGEERFIGPFKTSVFNQQSDRPNVYIDYSATTSVTLAIIRITPKD